VHHDHRERAGRSLGEYARRGAGRSPGPSSTSFGGGWAEAPSERSPTCSSRDRPD
jgi:hypothetical protein